MWLIGLVEFAFLLGGFFGAILLLLRWSDLADWGIRRWLALAACAMAMTNAVALYFASLALLYQVECGNHFSVTADNFYCRLPAVALWVWLASLVGTIVLSVRAFRRRPR